ncbi:unnamed protein product [Rotaria socialis]|uniref:Uncharacterized protein n=1 Tax=Rotaria socialis TaxID=392032 RepID=A0A820WEQ8_9BILA|nr:unnamed protein product [Rotaria socialis]CAF4515986.1 unnamed protein product [Rotaria socialis]
MFNAQAPYVARANRQQQQRRKKRKDTTRENIARDNNIRKVTASKPEELLQSGYLNSNTSTFISNYDDDDDDDDNIDWNENLVDLSADSSSLLYENSHISVKAAATSIMSMAIEFNFPKNLIERILKLIKTLLPIPKLLPTTLASILKLFDETPATFSKYYCNLCLKLCTLRAGCKLCQNDQCKLFDKVLRNRNIIEVVTLDIKQQLKSIITRNISLFGNNKFVEPFNISCGTYYKEMMVLSNTSNQISKNQICSISFNIHTDGAPLVRTTKFSLWPCMVSIVELPPQLLDLSKPFTISINGLQFYIAVRAQLFIADLLVKALF